MLLPDTRGKEMPQTLEQLKACEILLKVALNTKIHLFIHSFMYLIVLTK
jgi:hypothetical protein